MSKSTPSGTRAIGRVSLVGAGPGEPKLLTLRGQELLAQADIVLFDGLVNPETLRWAREDAQLMCVGKHGHGGMWTQKEIDDRTVQFAKEGNHVVRLKGGDTAVFARTSEEVDRLIAESVPYEIVPGVTAGLAATAYAGIPLTHRDWASAVALVTGQLQPSDGSNDSDDGIDWPALAVFPGTLVLYMGVTTAGHWSQELIRAGKSPKTAVALVRRVSWPEQEVIRCELGNVAETIRARKGFRPPVISIIGDVVNMPQTMNWFSQRPLFGKRILLTGTEQTNRKLSEQLSALGAHLTAQPVLRTVLLDDWKCIDPVILKASSYDWIVFSSPLGVEAFFDRVQLLGKDARVLGAAKLATVGRPTTEALGTRHLQADLTPDSPGIENLLPLLTKQLAVSSGEGDSGFEVGPQRKRVLFVRPVEGRDIAQSALESAGVECDCLHLYCQQVVETWPENTLKLVQDSAFDAVVVTSLHVAEQSVALMQPSHASVPWISISPRVTARLKELGCETVWTAEQSDVIGLVDCAKHHC